MKALILNSGMGTRMGELTFEQPKCMTRISENDTIISRQLRQIFEAGIKEVIITTGKYDSVLMKYCNSLGLSLDIIYKRNNRYAETNYIYSIYEAKEYLDDDILLIHGDLVFENSVLDDVLEYSGSCMVTSSTAKLPQKDFKAVIVGNRIDSIGIEYFNNAVAAQPFYKIEKKDWRVWLDNIIKYCESGNDKCYAENAFNDVSSECIIESLDVKDSLCSEVDTADDLEIVRDKLKRVENRLVYMCFSTDILHGGHIAIIKKASRLGKLVIGVLSDEAVSSYKRFPLIPFSERKIMFENVVGVHSVVEQKTLQYRENLLKIKPEIVVHGDDWKQGIQKSIREDVIHTLNQYGGRLVEFPYSNDKKYIELEKRAMAEIATPDMRRGRLKKLLSMKGLVTAMEAHNGLTGLIVENTVVEENGGTHQFDAMWVSSLCDSTAKGKPDIELVDMTSRFRTIDEICEVTTKPIIFDGDTGGLLEHFVYTVRSLERMGVSMIIIEDKTGLKKNSLFGNDIPQTQADLYEFAEKIKAGKKAQRTKDFMICARIESLILDKGIEDALERANVYVKAGADAIMIHSRKKEPDEIIEFVTKFRNEDDTTPIVVVPTSFDNVLESDFKKMGVNVVIYANQFTRIAFPAMQDAAKTILKNHRAKECNEKCMPFSEIIRLIPDEL